MVDGCAAAWAGIAVTAVPPSTLAASMSAVMMRFMTYHITLLVIGVTVVTIFEKYLGCPCVLTLPSETLA